MQRAEAVEDSFCSARSNNYEDMYSRMNSFVEMLEAQAFRVRRYKIEAVLFDRRVYYNE